MSVLSSRLCGVAICGAIALTLPVLALADVTMEEAISLTGVMKLMNMNGHTTTTISGDKARTDSNLTFESGMMRTFAGGMGNTSEIVHLGDDKIYSLNNKKKTYTETTFAEKRAVMEKAMAQQQKAQASQEEASSGVDESQCEWSEPKTEVVRSGEKATIGGRQAERMTITSTQACTDKKTKQVCEYGLTLDSWLAPGMQASSEAMRYYKTYAEKMGLGSAGSRDFAERAETMFGQYKGLWKAISENMNGSQGYPVKSSFSLGIGGAQCQSSQQQQAQSGGGQSSSSPTSLGGALGALGGMFGKKKQESAQPAAAPTTPPAATPNGLVQLMSISTELVSISENAVPAQTFEVPADYKKTKD